MNPKIGNKKSFPLPGTGQSTLYFGFFKSFFVAIVFIVQFEMTYIYPMFFIFCIGLGRHLKPEFWFRKYLPWRNEIFKAFHQFFTRLLAYLLNFFFALKAHLSMAPLSKPEIPISDGYPIYHYYILILCL